MTMAKKKQMTTRKATKVVGTQTWVDPNGELQNMQVMKIEERDANFHKLWLGHIIQSLDLIGNQKIKVLLFIMENLRDDNLLVMTLKRIEAKTGISYKTVQSTMKALQEANFLKQIQPGVYQVNPDVIFKGGKSKRLNVLLQYESIGEEEQQPKESETAKKAKAKGFEVIKGGETE